MQAKDLNTYLSPWLKTFIAEHPYVTGAYLAGSTAELAPEDDLGDCSDIDVMLTIKGEPRPKPGKIPFGGAVIEGTYIPWSTIEDPELALADYHIAHALHLGRILYDSDGHLTALCAAVAAEFPKPGRIRQRVDSVIRKIENNLNGYDPSAPEANRFMGLLFAAGIMAHAVLVAVQKNPTVRMRYRATKAVLADRPDAQEALLRAAGFDGISAAQAKEAVQEMAELFDRVSPLCKTAFPFTSDLQPEMRKSAVDDALALIDSGLHRESMFWTCATYARLMLQSRADAPEIFSAQQEKFVRFAGWIIPSQPERIATIRSALPALRSLCDAIIDQKP